MSSESLPLTVVEAVTNASSSSASTSIQTKILGIVVETLNGKDIRISNDGDYQHHRCTFVKGKLYVDEDEIKSVFDFMKRHGFNNRKTYRQFLEVFHDDSWIPFNLYHVIISSEDGRCLGMMALAVKAKLQRDDIVTKTEFHNHPSYRYNIVTDIMRGVICPLLRVCDKVPVGDLRRQSVASDSAVEYINSMCTHVRNGSRTVSQPFFSTSKNVEVIKYHSCAFLKPVILLDQELVKSRAFYFGGPAGRELFGESGIGPVRNFAEFSDEVLIDDFIRDNEYSIVEARFELKHELKSCKDFSVPAIAVLKTFEQLPLKTDRGGVLKLTNPSKPGNAYVWKVGNCKGHGSDSHICNEFVANVLYRAMGVPVPPAVLRMYHVELTAMQREKKVDIHSCDVYVLIHEFIVGEKAQLESHDHVRALALHSLADIVLCNYDVLGPNNLDNIIMRDGDAFRIDAGAALFTKPDGALKTNFAVSQRKAVDVQKDFVTYFSYKTAQCQRILQFLTLTPRFLSGRVNAMTQSFQKSISWFITKGGVKPPMWDNTLSLIKSRLESLLALADPDAFWKATLKLTFAKRAEAVAPAVVEESEPAAPVAELSADGYVPVERKIGVQGVKKKKFDETPDSERINVTSKSATHFARLSPFTAFRDKRGAAAFKVPFMPHTRSYSVEGIWQGLKVFEKEGVDTSKFDVNTGEQLKRTVKKHGKVLGHFGGIDQPLLSYVEARKQVYVPSYNHMLKSCCAKEMEELFELHLQKDIILLDYYTNCDIENTLTPLSHASLVKKRLHEMFAERYPQAAAAAAGAGGARTVMDGVAGGDDAAGAVGAESTPGKRKVVARMPRAKRARKSGDAVGAMSIDAGDSASASVIVVDHTAVQTVDANVIPSETTDSAVVVQMTMEVD